MTPLPHKVQHVLDESRLLIIGAQVLLALCVGLWFGWPLARRRSSRPARPLG